MIAYPDNRTKTIPLEEYQALSQAQAEKLLDMALTTEEKVLREFNKRYAIVRTSTTYILVQKSPTAFELDSRSSFKAFHENDFFINSQGKNQNKATFWLKHPQRRTFENIVFNPQKPGDYDDNYNIFKGFAIKPIQGCCDLYWQHILEVICSNNKEHYEYVRKWMACVVQKPTLLATALVLRGLQGTGKSKFAEYFGLLFGPYFLTVTNLEHITGKFNSHLKYAYLIYANEAIWGGSKKEVGALKALITDPTIIIEGKGKDAIQVENCRHLVVSSNEDWAVPMDLDDRRFFALNVSSHRKEDMTYFQKLDLQMRRGGLESLLHDLLCEDLATFDPRIMPSNDSGFDMKMKAASSVEKYLFEALKDGTFHLTFPQQYHDWGPLPSEQTYQLYKDWCLREGLKHEPSSEFGKRLKKLLRAEKSRRTINGGREWWYEFATIDESRKSFEKFTKQSSHIWEQ